ncbi:MAG: adenine nucleotide alpha hydrolase family protein [Candidatus Lokiarchaeota archaeon]|nr:adenine nucleotide alpha hydrolase family protein [Candidatus Lokiarchaeota archaeon]
MESIIKGKCSLCRKDAKLYLRRHSGQLLCPECLISSIERIIYRTISKYKMLNPEDTIIIGFSGGKDSVALLYNLIKIQKNTYGSKPIIALSIDEGIDIYRESSIKIARDFCKKYNIEHKIISFKKKIGRSLDEIIDLVKPKKDFRYPCNYCAILKRRLLNDEAKKLGGSVLALGFNLTDITETFLMNILYNRFHLIGNQYLFDNNKDYSFYLRKIIPLMKIPENEIQYYVKFKNLNFYDTNCPYREQYPILRKRVLEFIEKLKIKSPEIEFNLFNGFLELSKIFNKERENIDLTNCRKCNYPTSNTHECNYCKLIADLD